MVLPWIDRASLATHAPIEGPAVEKLTSTCRGHGSHLGDREVDETKSNHHDNEAPQQPGRASIGQRGGQSADEHLPSRDQRASKAEDGQEMEVPPELLHPSELAHVLPVGVRPSPFLCNRMMVGQLDAIRVVRVRRAHLLRNELGIHAGVVGGVRRCGHAETMETELKSAMRMRMLCGRRTTRQNDGNNDNVQ